jgi:hypothetical protein
MHSLRGKPIRSRQIVVHNGRGGVSPQKGELARELRLFLELAGPPQRAGIKEAVKEGMIWQAKQLSLDLAWSLPNGLCSTA